MRPLSRFRLTRICVKFGMITRIWHGRTPAAKSDEYFQLMRTVAIPDYRAIPGNTGAYALRRIEGERSSARQRLKLTTWR